MAKAKRPAAHRPVSAERKAQMAAASRRYRARKAAEKHGVGIPEAVALKRPAAYRPPRAESVKQLGETRAKTAARNRAKTTAAERASEKARQARQTRASVIENLPQARNPSGKIFVPRALDRSVTKNADAAAIRRKAASEKLQTAGRGLRRDFAQGDYADARRRLSASENARFSGLLRRLANVSPQTLAIYFHHEGGSGEFSQVIQGILYPPDGSSPSEALDRLEVVADAVERGEQLYGEKSEVGKLNI